MVLHEMMHALNALHYEGDAMTTGVHTVTNDAAFKGGHLGTEHHGNPFAGGAFHQPWGVVPGSDVCGDNDIPLADNIFLDLSWPSRDIYVQGWPKQYMWEYQAYGSGQRVVPRGYGEPKILEWN